MLFTIKLPLILIWCYLFLIILVSIVSSDKKHRFFHHQHQKQLDSDYRLSSLFHRRFDKDPCTRPPCEISNECIRIQHRSNHTKFRYRCTCRDRPCRRRVKNRKTQMKYI